MVGIPTISFRNFLHTPEAAPLLRQSNQALQQETASASNCEPPAHYCFIPARPGQNGPGGGLI